MSKRWAVSERPGEDAINKLAGELNIDTVLSALLINRGINTFDEAKYFFRPDLRHLHDPFLMAEMEKSVDRIEMPISTCDKIFIYGYYDVVVTTPVALVYSFYKKNHDN